MWNSSKHPFEHDTWYKRQIKKATSFTQFQKYFFIIQKLTILNLGLYAIRKIYVQIKWNKNHFRSICQAIHLRFFNSTNEKLLKKKNNVGSRKVFALSKARITFMLVQKEKLSPYFSVFNCANVDL